MKNKKEKIINTIMKMEFFLYELSREDSIKLCKWILEHENIPYVDSDIKVTDFDDYDDEAYDLISKYAYELQEMYRKTNPKFASSMAFITNEIQRRIKLSKDLDYLFNSVSSRMDSESDNQIQKNEETRIIIDPNKKITFENGLGNIKNDPERLSYLLKATFKEANEENGNVKIEISTEIKEENKEEFMEKLNALISEYSLESSNTPKM